MEWTEPDKRKRRRPHRYVLPGMEQLAIQAPGALPAASPQTPLNIIGMLRYYVSHVDIGMQDVARKIMHRLGHMQSSTINFTTSVTRPRMRSAFSACVCLSVEVSKPRFHLFACRGPKTQISSVHLSRFRNSDLVYPSVGVQKLRYPSVRLSRS